ncbi:hypothetical protein B0X34_00270 [Helicobacter pylori]|nr:hypothetical protein B0X34_00270 [Helicobacter pylori]
MCSPLEWISVSKTKFEKQRNAHFFFKIRAFFKIHVPFFIYLTYGKFFLINIFKELLCKKMKTH